MNGTDKCILLVENKEADASYFRRAMKEAGFEHEVFTASSNEMAMDFLLKRNAFSENPKCEFPAAVFLDLILSGDHAFDLLKWIREEPTLREIPVIVLTHREEIQIVRKVYDLGARSYIRKPVKPQELANISDYLRK